MDRQWSRLWTCDTNADDEIMKIVACALFYIVTSTRRTYDLLTNDFHPEKCLILVSNFPVVVVSNRPMVFLWHLVMLYCKLPITGGFLKKITFKLIVRICGFLICPIAIAYSMGQIINRFASICLCVCLSVCPCIVTLTVAFLCRFSPNLTQRCKSPKVRTSSLRVNITPPVPMFYP